ncbi:MAG: protein-L-isoaspartate(D-aspartate) O-methyltransferase [Alphaproteobacteria bacterium]|nr:protein-L-isoaspartate(D-aspartate) O-methyltransferase [Alphaproteobacteria bacterium]
MLEQRAMLIMTLRGQGVRDTSVLNALEVTPRDAFVPQALRQHAYDNVSLPIAHGQTISQPYVVARMTEELELTGRERVLEIGTGSGYQAAVLSYLSRRVYSIERLRPLLVEADRRLSQLKITNYTSKLADGALGWPEAAPFDRIILTCAAADHPRTLLEQLKPGGIMIAPVDVEGGHQAICKYRKDTDGQITTDQLFDVKFVPLVTDNPTTDIADT